METAWGPCSSDNAMAECVYPSESTMSEDRFDRLDSMGEYGDTQSRPYLLPDRASPSRHRPHPHPQHQPQPHSPSHRHDHLKHVLLCTTFVIELLVIAFVIVLEYFLRWTDVFPLRRQNFSCSDTSIQCPSEAWAALMADFAFKANVPTAAIFALSFCVPPFVILIGEIGLYTFTSEPQKSIRLGSRRCHVPQIFRRLLRFLGVFLFGAFSLMVLVDITRLMVGRLRPDFLAVCRVNATQCGAAPSPVLGLGDSACLNTDSMAIRQARMSFPSLNAALTAYASLFVSIYIQGAMTSHTVRVMRPFLVLVLLLLAVLCALAEVALCRAHWEDAAVGLAAGFLLALYLGVVVLNKFQEHVSHAALLAHLKSYMAENYLAYEERTLVGPPWDPLATLHIPRVQVHPPVLTETLDSKHRRRVASPYSSDLPPSDDYYRRHGPRLSASHM